VPPRSRSYRRGTLTTVVFFDTEQVGGVGLGVAAVGCGACRGPDGVPEGEAGEGGRMLAQLVAELTELVVVALHACPPLFLSLRLLRAQFPGKRETRKQGNGSVEARWSEESSWSGGAVVCCVGLLSPTS
jgi:hypothetical protein